MNLEARTTSILMSEEEYSEVAGGLRTIYRPITLHWDRQLKKFTEPRQATLIGFEVQDIAHIMVDTGRPVTNDDGSVVKDPNGEPRTHKVKRESRVVKRVTDEAIYPEDFRVNYPGLLPGDKCWLVVLGEKVG